MKKLIKLIESGIDEKIVGKIVPTGYKNYKRVECWYKGARVCVLDHTQLICANLNSLALQGYFCWEK